MQWQKPTSMLTLPPLGSTTGWISLSLPASRGVSTALPAVLAVLLRRMWRRKSFWVRVMWGPGGGVTVMTSKGSALGTALYAWLLLGPACRQQQGCLRLNKHRPLTAAGWSRITSRGVQSAAGLQHLCAALIGGTGRTCSVSTTSYKVGIRWAGRQAQQPSLGVGSPLIFNKGRAVSTLMSCGIMRAVGWAPHLVVARFHVLPRDRPLPN